MRYNLVLLILISFNLTQNYSQVKDSNNLVYCGIDISSTYIKSGNSLIGPAIGYSLKSKVLSYGINYEYAFAQNQTGIFTAGIAGKYSAKNESLEGNTGELKNSVISAGLKCNFNLNNLSAKSIVPFAGLMIGYNYSVTKYEFNNSAQDPLFPDTKRHSMYIFGEAGVRFFISRNMALNIKAGSGNIDKSILEIGFDYRF